ncbi:NUDIX domain-containing protein [Nocardioides pacificus]
MSLEIVSAGGVVTRSGRDVLLVHRPRYDDWSFPKGHLDPGEHSTTAAVREVLEETGVAVRLGPPLRAQRYPVGERMKTVHYWVARVVGADDVSGYAVNDEIDRVEWVSYDEAMDRLTYDFDRDTLREALGESAPVRKETRPLVVLRHGKATSRKQWTSDDRLRPLAEAGVAQAAALVPVLAAYGVQRVVTSSSVRCAETVRPYAEAHGVEPASYDVLSEEDATAESVAAVVGDLLAGTEPKGSGSVLCTHRPVLPLVWDALGLPAVRLEPGAMLVVHHRKGKVVATELHASL